MARIAKEASRTVDNCYIHTSTDPLYSEGGFWSPYPPKKISHSCFHTCRKPRMEREVECVSIKHDEIRDGAQWGACLLRTRVWIPSIHTEPRVVVQPQHWKRGENHVDLRGSWPTSLVKTAIPSPMRDLVPQNKVGPIWSPYTLSSGRKPGIQAL